MTGNRSKSSTPKDVTSVGSVYLSLIYPVASAIYIVCFLNLLYRACLEAYDIRLYAIKEYGRVIHEFDPYFNYRAAEVRMVADERNSHTEELICVFV